ncbi:MAG: GrdB-related putative oxidoreductase [Anaerorhabdus sp.]
MKIVLIFDQGLAGAGGKGNPNVELTAVKGGVGSSLMLEPHFNKINADVVATLYCGNQFFLDHQDEVVTKMSAMVKKINPDFVVCGPCFNFNDYALMSSMITKSILEKTSVKCCAMMSKENDEIIQNYKDIIPIVKMPKKGGTGLNESITNLCDLIDATLKNENLDEVRSKVCY